MRVEEGFLQRATSGAPIARDALARALVGLDISSTEASGRWGRTHRARGNRVMIERAPASVVLSIADALGCTLPDDARALVEHATKAGVPLIGGWDADGSHVATKIYANASDGSTEARARLWDAAGWPAQVDGRVPHLAALNVSRDGRVERKVYLQGAAAEGDHAESLARDARDLGVLAGTVAAWTIDSEALRARAFFVAVRDDDAERVEAFLNALDGFDADALAEALPFDRGQCRSVGVTLHGEPTWTAYFKPRGHGAPLHRIDPIAIFEAGESEVAIFSAPPFRGQRAYAIVGERAISYRVTRGEPDARHVVRLMRWVVDTLARAELSAPPEPWKSCVIDSCDGDASTWPAKS